MAGSRKPNNSASKDVCRMPISLPSVSGINTEARTLIFVGAIMNFGFAFYFVALPVYLSVAGFSPTVIGLLLAVEAVIGFSLAIPLAMLSDIRGRKGFFILGILAASVAGAILYFTLNLILIVLAAAFSGLANALMSAPALALLAEKATDDRSRNDIFTLSSAFGGVATALGALISGILPALFAARFGFGVVGSFRPLFALSATLGIVGLVVVQLKIHEARRSKTEGSNGGAATGGFMKIPRKSLPVVMRFSMLGLIGFGAGLIIPLFPLWFHLRFGLDISVIGPLFSAMLFVTALASLLTPYLARRRGSVLTIALTQICSIPFLILIPFSGNYVLAGVAMVARNMLMNVSGPMQHSYQMGVIHPDERATASSIIQTFDAVPRAFAPAIGGYMFSLGLLDLPFFFTAALYTTSILLFYFIFRGVRPLD